jgi:hypothetical protein
MPASTIIVQHGDGSPARHVGVALGFPSGNTDAYFTDNYGQAVVEHSSVGGATVFVSGRDCCSFHVPGKYAVTV